MPVRVLLVLINFLGSHCSTFTLSNHSRSKMRATRSNWGMLRRVCSSRLMGFHFIRFIWVNNNLWRYRWAAWLAYSQKAGTNRTANSHSCNWERSTLVVDGPFRGIGSRDEIKKVLPSQPNPQAAHRFPHLTIPAIKGKQDGETDAANPCEKGKINPG